MNDELCPEHPHSQPTSLSAWDISIRRDLELLAAGKKTKSQRILEFIEDSKEEGATYFEVEAGTRIPNQSTAPTIAKLVQQGKVQAKRVLDEEVGRKVVVTRPNVNTGAPCIVWVAEETHPTDKRTFKVTLPLTVWEQMEHEAADIRARGDELFSPQQYAASVLMRALGHLDAA